MTEHTQQSSWQQLSPRQQQKKAGLPAAITLHRLVPHPSQRPKTQSSTHTAFKYLTPEEIEEAQSRAQRLIAEAKLTGVTPAQSTNKSIGGTDKHKDGKKTGLESKQRDDKADKNKKTESGRHSRCLESKEYSSPTRPGLPVYRGIGESTLRTRQIGRLVLQISEVLRELENMQNRPDQKTFFIIPQDDKLKRKRWEEFHHSAGRTIFSLKREVVMLERTCKQGEKGKSKFLRMMATTTRTLLRLLLALKSHAGVGVQSPVGRKLSSDLAFLASRVFSLVCVLGIKPPKMKLKSVQFEEQSLSNLESTESSEIASSDLDSDTRFVLYPDYIQERIAKLAQRKLSKKRKKQQGYGQVTAAKANSKGDKVLAPLKCPEKATHQSPFTGTDGYGYTLDNDSSSTTKIYRGNKVVSFSKDSVAYTIESDTRRRPRVADQLGKSDSKDSHGTSSNTTLSRNIESEEVRESPEQSSHMEPSTQSACKMTNETRLVEHTADAVVSKLLPLIGQSMKIQEGSDDREAQTSTKPEEWTMPVEDVAHKIHILLERLCKIEDNHRRAKGVIMEASDTLTITPPDPSQRLEEAIRQARQVMASQENCGSLYILPSSQQTQYSIPVFRNETTSAPLGHKIIDNYGNESAAKTLLKKNNAFQSGRGQVQMTSNNKHVIVSNVNDTSLADSGGSVTDQVRKQKEEFWATLVKRGFVRPYNVMASGSEVAAEVAEKILKQDSVQDYNHLKAKDTVEDIHKQNCSVEHIQEKKKLDNIKSTNEKRKSALALCSTGHHSKETQIGSSLSKDSSLQDSKSGDESACTSQITSSHESSPERTDNDSRESEGDRDHDHDQNGNVVSSAHTNTTQSSSDISKSNGSQSFPSYSGVSKSE